MSKVYIVQETNHNIEPARKFGTLQVMLTYADIKKGPDHVVKCLRKRMASINSQDCIVCLGDPMAIGIAIHIGLIFTGGRVRILKWDRVKLVYHEEEIEVNKELL